MAVVQAAGPWGLAFGVGGVPPPATIRRGLVDFYFRALRVCRRSHSNEGAKHLS